MSRGTSPRSQKAKRQRKQRRDARNFGLLHWAYEGQYHSGTVERNRLLARRALETSDVYRQAFKQCVVVPDTDESFSVSMEIPHAWCATGKHWLHLETPTGGWMDCTCSCRTVAPDGDPLHDGHLVRLSRS